MVPLWTRLYRFANVYAYAAIDLLYTLLWFAAFIAVAVWRASGKTSNPDKNDSNNDTNKEDNKNDGGTCANWKYGSAAKCEVAQASVGFGVVIFLLFAGTSAISIYGVLQFRRTGIMPNGNSRTHGQAERLDVDDGGKDAWSTNTDDLEPSRLSNANEDPRRAYGQLPMEEDSQSQNLLQRPSLQAEDPFADTHSMTEHGMHPGRALSYQSSTNLSIVTPPSYHEQSSVGAGGTSPSGYVAPSALSPSDYAETPGGRVNFPRGNYGI